MTALDAAHVAALERFGDQLRATRLVAVDTSAVLVREINQLREERTRERALLAHALLSLQASHWRTSTCECGDGCLLERPAVRSFLDGIEAATEEATGG